MAAVLRSSFVVFHGSRALSTAPALSRAKTSEDPIKALFLQKLKEFKSKGNIPMSQETQKEYNDEMSRLKRIYGADKNDLSEFPTFKFD
jgi:hypothetical protein